VSGVKDTIAPPYRPKVEHSLSAQDWGSQKGKNLVGGGRSPTWGAGITEGGSPLPSENPRPRLSDEAPILRGGGKKKKRGSALEKRMGGKAQKKIGKSDPGNLSSQPASARTQERETKISQLRGVQNLPCSI